MIIPTKQILIWLRLLLVATPDNSPNPFAILSTTRSQTTHPESLGLDREAFQLLNKERRGQGGGPLQVSKGSTLEARWDGQDMAGRRFLSHVRPDGNSVVDRIRLARVRGAWKRSENAGPYTGAGDLVTTTVYSWLLSPADSRTMLNPQFRYTGIGAARYVNGTVNRCTR